MLDRAPTRQGARGERPVQLGMTPDEAQSVVFEAFNEAGDLGRALQAREGFESLTSGFRRQVAKDLELVAERQAWIRSGGALFPSDLDVADAIKGRMVEAGHLLDGLVTGVELEPMIRALEEPLTRLKAVRANPTWQRLEHQQPRFRLAVNSLAAQEAKAATILADARRGDSGFTRQHVDEAFAFAAAFRDDVATLAELLGEAPDPAAPPS